MTRYAWIIRDTLNNDADLNEVTKVRTKINNYVKLAKTRFYNNIDTRSRHTADHYTKQVDDCNGFCTTK